MFFIPEALIVMRRGCVAVCGGVLESVTITVKFEVPATVGVPEIFPVVASSDRPSGRDPALMLQLTGSVP